MATQRLAIPDHLDLNARLLAGGQMGLFTMLGAGKIEVLASSRGFQGFRTFLVS